MLTSLDKLLSIDLEQAKRRFQSKEASYKVSGERLVIRLDGVSFSVNLSDFKKPRDERVREAMEDTAIELMKRLGAIAAYVVSDEINLFLGSYVPFDGREFKLVSVSSGIASSYLSIKLGRPLYFDSRIVLLNTGEDIEYVTWRARLAAGNYLSNFTNRPFREAIELIDDMNYIDCCGSVIKREWSDSKPSEKIVRKYSVIDVISGWNTIYR